MPTPKWIKEQPQPLSAWMRTLMDNGPIWGRFKISPDAFIPYSLPVSGHMAGLIMTISPHFPGDTPENHRACAEWALPLQDPETTFFIDPMYEQHLPLKIARSPERLAGFRRVASSKTLVLLLRAGLTPRYQLRLQGQNTEPSTDAEVILNQLRAMNWNNPWGACSQTSRILGDLFQHYILKGREEYIPAFQAGLEFLLSKQDPETGFWKTETETSIGERMSGAKKSLALICWVLGIKPPHIRQIADNVLRIAQSGELFSDAPRGSILYDRNNLELAAMVYMRTDYRHAEFRAYIEQVVEDLKKYSQPDGGFAQDYTGVAPIYYQDVKHSEAASKPRGDMIGLAGAFWVFEMAALLLNWEDYPFHKIANFSLQPAVDRPYRVHLDERDRVHVVKK